MKTYVAECSIIDKRNVVVEAEDKQQAREKIQNGHYKRLGRSQERGFLTIGEPREQS